MAAAVEVCDGGSCGENGGERLLEVGAALAPGLKFVPAMCSGLCPDKGVAVCARKNIDDSYVTKTNTHTATDAINAAVALIEAAGKKPPAPELVTAVTAWLAAKEANAGGDDDVALRELDVALREVPPEVLEPSQEPLPAESTAWGGSKWEEALGGSELVFAESVEEGEYGHCGNGVVLFDCEEQDGALSGRWRDESGAGGEFELKMSANGRHFEGELRHAGSEQELVWTGMRKGVGVGMRRVCRGEPAPRGAAWLHASLVLRSRLRLAAGDAAAALEDARAATVLCCRDAGGWRQLGEAADAADDEAAADAAWDEVAWLESWA